MSIRLHPSSCSLYILAWSKFHDKQRSVLLSMCIAGTYCLADLYDHVFKDSLPSK